MTCRPIYDLKENNRNSNQSNKLGSPFSGCSEM